MHPKLKKKQNFAEIMTLTRGKPNTQQIEPAAALALSLTDYNKLTDNKPEQSQTKLRLYDQSTVTPARQVKLRCTASGITRKVHFIFQVIKVHKILYLTC